MSKKLIISDERKLNDLTGIGKTIRPLVKQLLGKNGIMLIELMENWEEIVGSKLCCFVLPQKIQFAKDERSNGVLYLIVSGGAFAMEVENNKLKILQKVNAFFGYEAISNIKILQNSNAKDFLINKNVSDKPKKNLVSEMEKTYISGEKDIENEKLRLRLESLGQAILKRNKNTGV